MGSRYRPVRLLAASVASGLYSLLILYPIALKTVCLRTQKSKDERLCAAITLTLDCTAAACNRDATTSALFVRTFRSNSSR